MQTQTQMEIQASSHVQRKRKEREIRKRSRSFSKMADNDWAFAVSHVWEANANTNWKMFYHTIYCVIQGFPALRKALTTHVKKKKCDIFSRAFDIANQLLTRYMPFAPLGQVDERTTKSPPFSIQGRLSDYFRIMAARKLKYPHTLQKQWRACGVSTSSSKLTRENNRALREYSPKFAFLAFPV